MRGALSDYDVFVLPSHYEGNSNAILEAMAAGLPVVSTRVGGTPMQVGEAGAKFLHEPGDTAALAELMKQFIADAGLRAELGLAMRHRAEQFFDISQVASTYACAYRLLSAGKRNEVASASSPVVIGHA